MSVDGAPTNVTEMDYSDAYSDAYYDAIENYAPCETHDVTTFGKVFLPVLYSLVFILGFVGNGLVVCVLVKYRNQTNLTDICLFNLAISDLLFVLTLPFYSHYAMVSEWTFGDFLCRFVSGSHTTGFFSSIFFMIVMTVDRYLVIMHTHKVARYRSLRPSIVMTLLVWMLSFSISLPAFIFTKVANDSLLPSCCFIPDNEAWKLYDLVTTNTLGLLIPLLVMVGCYSRIVPTLMGLRTPKKHRIVKLIISIMAAFFIFWAPYNICLFLLFLKNADKLQVDDKCRLDANLKLAVTVTEAFAYTHCCLNPVIYAFVGQKFMKRALQLLSNFVPKILLPSTRDLSDSSYRKSSFMSRSSDVTPTFIR